MQVASTGYGAKVINKPPPPEAPAPTFKPEIVESEQAKKLREAANSSGYGKVLVNKKPPPEVRADNATRYFIIFK